MNKKIIAIIVLVLLVLCGIGYFLTNSIGSASVGSSVFSVPDGFSTSYSNNTAIVKNNVTTFYVNDKTNESIDSIFNNYKNKYKDDTVKEGSTTVGNVTVRSITLSQNDTKIHTNYYYVVDNNTYHVFIKGKNNKTAFEEIVSSTRKSSLPF